MAQDDKKALELSEFIRLTLVQLVKGVEQARDDIGEMETNAEICPTGLHFARGNTPAPFKPGRGFVQEVEFDVAVTVSRGRSREGAGEGTVSIGVPSMPLLGGAAVEGRLRIGRQRERSEVSRVTFKVPVLLPSEVYPWDEKEQGQTNE